MALLLAAALRRAPRAVMAPPLALAGFWLLLEWMTGDSRLLFPFAMTCAAAAAWRFGIAGATAGAALFLLQRAVAGAAAGVLMTEAAGSCLALGAALAARRGGPSASAAAGSLAGLAALLL